MVELNTLLAVGLVGFGAGVVVTAALVLLFVIYNSIKAVSDKQKDDEETGYAIPLSMMGGAGGAGRGLTIQDLQAYAQRQAAAGQPEDTKKAEAGGGTYL